MRLESGRDEHKMKFRHCCLQGENAAFEFRFDDPSDAFHLDLQSGRITVKNQLLLDRETTPVFTLKVKLILETPLMEF